MKFKRSVCVVLTAAIIIGSLPHTLYASAGNTVITDVETHRSWDLTRSRYITYTWNGVKFDSRETGPQFNLSAFRIMNEEQREKVARWMAAAGYERRRLQFSEEGAVELMEKYDTVTGWKEAGKILKQRIEKKYCNDLVQFYGSDDINEPDKFYKQECQRLTFADDSAAHKLRYDNDNYAAYEGLNEFIEKYDAIQEHLSMGKKAYNCLADEMTKATEYAVKGSSKEFISLVCDKVLVSEITPSSAISSIKKGYFCRCA